MLLSSQMRSVALLYLCPGKQLQTHMAMSYQLQLMSLLQQEPSFQTAEQQGNLPAHNLPLHLMLLGQQGENSLRS